MRDSLAAAVLTAAMLAPAAAAAPSAAASTTGMTTGSAGTLYVDNELSNTVTPISIATGTGGKPIKAGNTPTTMQITPDGKTLYVVDSSRPAGMVTPIATATNKPGKPIRTGNTPSSIVCAPTVCRSSSTTG